MARCSHWVIFYFKEKFCVSARVGKSIARCLSCLTLSKNLYLRLYFLQIVHSYGKMLFLAPNNCASLTFFKEKLRVLARVSKSLAWTVFTCVEKMVSLGCVCCMKMGLKRVSPVPFDKKQWIFDWMAKIISLSINVQSVKINCKMLGPFQTPLHSCAEPNSIRFDFGVTLERRLIQTAYLHRT